MSFKKQSKSYCRICKYAYKLNRRWSCLSFPDGIPDEYMWYGAEHRQLTGNESEKLTFNEMDLSEFETYRASGKFWYSLERIKELGHDKKPL